MVVNLDRLFANRTKLLKSSEIRELLKLTHAPGIISFAGGLPNPQAFPVEVINKCIDKVFDEHILRALQYGTTEGLPLLRGALAERMKQRKGMDCEMHDIIITNGAQQALTLVAFCFLNPGDTYISSKPTYLAAIQSFAAFEANCESIPLNAKGMDIDSLRRNLKRLHNTGVVPKFIYTVPTFQNPAGVLMSLDRRKELLEIASDYDLIIIEDDPYGEIFFEGEEIPSIKSMDTKGRVVYISTFSKILAPGFRLGWIIASEEIINKFALAKQSMDLCSNVFSQYVAYEYINGGYLDLQLEKIRALYKNKRNIMLESIEEYFPREVKWTIPQGGMFLWITLPKSIDARLMFKRALEKKVAYVIGDAFHPDGKGHNTMRLNFSYSEDDVIEEGIKRLAEVIQEEMEGPYEEESHVADGV
ncbi:MAG: PLP-dependent aminotransferase family protein [Thermoplasmata archaeon]|nr:MAG: PLP-dependent aminotransferase family protein [Thermoplasmata archaeon]